MREDAFLNRRRPRSTMAIVAGIAFVLTTGAYGGLYYSNDLLNQDVAKKTIEIKKTQQDFKNAPEVDEARVFRARADLASELLNSHVVASPVLAFLSKNTAEKIMYEKFSFKTSPEGPVLELSGEAETYAVLAYQADVFRTKTKELSKFIVTNFGLTKFGTVTFSFAMTFTPEYLLYVRNVSSDTSDDNKTNTPIVSSSSKTAVVISDKSTVSAKTSTSTEEGKPLNISATTTATVSKLTNSSKETTQSIATTSRVTSTPAKQSKLMDLWSKFKFW